MFVYHKWRDSQQLLFCRKGIQETVKITMSAFDMKLSASLYVTCWKGNALVQNLYGMFGETSWFNLQVHFLYSIENLRKYIAEWGLPISGKIGNVTFTIWVFNLHWFYSHIINILGDSACHSGKTLQFYNMASQDLYLPLMLNVG